MFGNSSAESHKIILSGISVWQKIDYESRKDSGNERWKQIENMILDNKKQIEEIRGELENVG